MSAKGHDATTTGWPASSSGATNPDRPAFSSAMTYDHPRPSGLGIYHDRPRPADPLVCRKPVSSAITFDRTVSLSATTASAGLSVHRDHLQPVGLLVRRNHL